MDKYTRSISPDEIVILITRCANGDDASQAEFYTIFYEYISMAVSSAISKYQPSHFNQSDTQEMAHDIFLHITQDNYAALRRLHTPSSLNAWLMRVAHNHVLSQLRKVTTKTRAYQNMARETHHYTAATPEENAIDKEERQLLDLSIEALSHQEQLMLNLYYKEGRKYSEIAEILNISINTVASRLHRAKAKLHDTLKDKTL